MGCENKIKMDGNKFFFPGVKQLKQNRQYNNFKIYF